MSKKYIDLNRPMIGDWAIAIRDFVARTAKTAVRMSGSHRPTKESTNPVFALRHILRFLANAGVVPVRKANRTFYSLRWVARPSVVVDLAVFWGFPVPNCQSRTDC